MLTRTDYVPDLFIAVANQITWCHLATVDAQNRPRSRVVHPLWSKTDDSLVGWVGTRPTPLKRAHLAHSPFVSCSYLSNDHDVAVAECHASWIDNADERARAWDRFKVAPPPVGYDPGTIWSSPAADDFAVLKLVPWRLRLGIGTELAAGAHPLVWRE